MKGFVAGFIVSMVLCGAGAVWAIIKIEDQPIRFASKRTFNGGDFYHFEGSVYGVGDDAPVNNFIDGWCYRDRMECELISINEIGARHLGAMNSDTLKVRKWDDREIIADTQGTNPRQCNWYEIKADLKTEEIAYTRIPNKSPQADCMLFQSGSRVMRWSIDNGKAWQEGADGTPRLN